MNTFSKAGPVSLAARLTKNAAPPQQANIQLLDVEPLWTTKELGSYLGKSKNSLSEFLNRTPDFPAFKIGSEWRADANEVKAWVRRQRAQACPSNENGETV